MLHPLATNPHTTRLPLLHPIPSNSTTIHAPLHRACLVLVQLPPDSHISIISQPPRRLLHHSFNIFSIAYYTFHVYLHLLVTMYSESVQVIKIAYPLQVIFLRSADLLVIEQKQNFCKLQQLLFQKYYRTPRPRPGGSVA